MQLLSGISTPEDRGKRQRCTLLYLNLCLIEGEDAVGAAVNEAATTDEGGCH